MISIEYIHKLLDVYNQLCRPLCQQTGIPQTSLDILMFLKNNPQYKNADSMKLLETVADMLKMRALRVSSADITVIAQAPKLSPYISDMRANIAKALQLPQDRANVKATTTERLGFTGRKEGIAAMAAVLLSED